MTTTSDDDGIPYGAYDYRGGAEPSDGPLRGEFQDRGQLIQKIQQQQQQRRVAAPFQGKDPPSTHGAFITSDTGYTSGYLSDNNYYGMTASGKDGREADLRDGASNGYSAVQGLPHNRGYHDDHASYPSDKGHRGDRDYHGDRGRASRSPYTLDSRQRQGHVTYENGRRHDSPPPPPRNDRQFLPGSPSGNGGGPLGGDHSDGEVERQLERLRKQHEQALEEKRLDLERSRAGDVRESPDSDGQRRYHGDRQSDEKSGPERNGRKESDGRYDRDGDRPYHRRRGDDDDDVHHRRSDTDRDRDRRENSPRGEDQLVDSPGSQRIRQNKHYQGQHRSYPQKHYSSAPNSEPSHSRDVSPDPHRSRSQPYLRLVFDSDDYHNDSNVSDDPGVTFDRYARRATRANVLNKAEELLNRRQSQVPQLYSISESNGEETNQRTKSQRRIPVYQSNRKVAFAQEEEASEEDQEEEEEADAEEGDSENGDLENGHGSFSSGIGGLSDTTERTKKSRLMKFNTRMRTTKRRGRVPFRGIIHRRKAGPQSVSEYDQASSESDDEVVRFNYDDPTRYEAARLRPPDGGVLPAPTERSLDEEPGRRKARRAWFFRNGDLDFKPKQLVISQKTYPNFETLLVDLGQLVPTVAGVKYLFSWPDGREIKSVTEIQNDRYYVCASVNRLQKINYGNSREQYWKGGKFKPDESYLFTKQNGQVVQSPSNPRPRVVTLISNMNRDSHEKLILNTSTSQNYEDMLGDLHHMVSVPHPPVTALYTEAKPYIKVEGFAHLFRDLKDHSNFLVCGQEGQPVEPKKRPLPSSNSSNDSVTGKGALRNSKLLRGDNSVSPDRRLGAGTKRTEPIRVDINGKKREFFAPSEPFVDSDGQKPDKKFKLDWVYGFRGRDVKQNLVVLPNTGELVYFVASIVVLYDRRTHTQKHYTAHTEEVTCLAIHPRDPFIASGQMAGRSPEGGAHIRVWDGISLSTYAIVGLGVFQQGVSCVSFSERDSNGDLLLAIDDSDRHVMSVWEWQTETLTAKTTTTNDPVVYGCFYPFDDTILVTFGKQHLYFWTVFWKRADGKILRDKKSGIFEDDVPKFVTAICFGISGDVITGDSTGSILVWSHDEENIFRIDRQASAPMKCAHKTSVSSLVMLSDGVLLSGGGSEIKAWDSLMRYKMLKERSLPESHGPVRTIVPQNANGVDGYLFVGTARDLVLEGSLQSKFRPIVQGHCEELWAVASHPKEPAFFTAGHDMAVAKWSALSHSLIWLVKDKKPCTSIGVDPSGQLVAVGTTTGRVVLYGSGDGSERNSLHVGKAQINAISFSRDGSQLAVGAHDGFIHVFVVHDDGQFFRQQSAALRHNSTFIMHLDWSVDGRFLQTVLGDYELVFWDVSNMQKLKSGRTVRDADWNTCSSPAGYPLIGAWQSLGRGDVINVCCRSHYRDYIATGDSVGRLRLYKYPCVSQKAESRTVKPFSSNTTTVEFMADDRFLLASGGSDAALVQYELVTR